MKRLNDAFFGAEEDTEQIEDDGEALDDEDIQMMGLEQGSFGDSVDAD